MRVLKKVLAIPVCAVFLWLVPAVVQADPIRVTGGVAIAPFFSDLSLAVLTGEGLAITGEGAGSHSGGPDFVGTTADLDGGFEFFTVSGALSQTVDGTTYRALLDGNLSFTTESFVVQPPPGGNGSVTTFSLPFTMTGSIQGYTPTGLFGREPGALLFSIDVFGTGTATQTKTFNASTGFYGPPQASIRYTFGEAAAAPTPEPASLLLLGTGLAGLVMRQRKRTR